MIKAPHGRSWMHYAFGVILNATLFLIAGPLLGALTIWVMVPFLSFVANLSVVASQGIPSPLSLIAWFGNFIGGFFVLGLPLGYMHAWKAALVTGALVAVMSSFIDKPGWLYAASGVVGIIVSLELVPVAANRSEPPYWVYFIPAGAGAISAVICTRFAAGLRLRPVNVAVMAETN